MSPDIFGEREIMGKSYKERIEQAGLLSVVIGIAFYACVTLLIMIILRNGKILIGPNEAIEFCLPILLGSLWTVVPLSCLVGDGAKKKLIESIDDEYGADGIGKDGFSKEGYDRDGFDRSGYDKYGFDRDGYNRRGRDRGGYDRFGYTSQGFDRDGFDRDGYDREGYDRDGFNAQGRDRDGFYADGYNQEGYDRDGYDRHGYDVDSRDREGYNRTGFGRDGYNRKGFDKDGYDRAGYNVRGFDRDGYDKDGYDVKGFDRRGFDAAGYDREGFTEQGFNRARKYKNGSFFDEQGYDVDGFDQGGFNREGYDREGFDRAGFNSSGFDRDGFSREGYSKSGYDRNGFDRDGYDADGFDWQGFNKEGYDRAAFDRRGFDRNGMHRNGTMYDEAGYDVVGYDSSGYDADGYDRDGFDAKNRDIVGRDLDGYDLEGYNREGFDRFGESRTGVSKTEIDAAFSHVEKDYSVAESSNKSLQDVFYDFLCAGIFEQVSSELPEGTLHVGVKQKDQSPKLNEYANRIRSLKQGVGFLEKLLKQRELTAFIFCRATGYGPLYYEPGIAKEHSEKALSEFGKRYKELTLSVQCELLWCLKHQEDTAAEGGIDAPPMLDTVLSTVRRQRDYRLETTGCYLSAQTVSILNDLDSSIDYLELFSNVTGRKDSDADNRSENLKRILEEAAAIKTVREKAYQAVVQSYAALIRAEKIEAAYEDRFM